MLALTRNEYLSHVPDYCRHKTVDWQTGLKWSCQPECWSCSAAAETHSRQHDATQSACTDTVCNFTNLFLLHTLHTWQFHLVIISLVAAKKLF